MAIPTSIKTLLSGDVVEWARIEFKETWDAAASLKSICAFANDLDNWGGGYIVIGVQENNGRPVFPLKGVPTEKLDLINSITGFENKSGTVRYEGTMQLEKIDTERSIQLELGNTYETAEVFVNGHSEGVRICKPYRFHLTGHLREGENQLAVEVTNTLGTQMRDAISHYLPIEPFGVEGMVHLYMGK